MVWYSHLLKKFPQFVVIHTGKGFGIVNKAEVVIFLEQIHKFNTYVWNHLLIISEYNLVAIYSYPNWTETGCVTPV